MDGSKTTSQAGGTGTFIIHVRCRQNATWQGEVAWAEREKRQHFRSALELLKMIDGALDEGPAPPPGAAPEAPQAAS